MSGTLKSTKIIKVAALVFQTAGHVLKVLSTRQRVATATAGGQGSHTHHDEVPHARGFSHQRGDAAAAGHQDDFKRLRVEEVVEQLGGFPWVALRKAT